VVSPTNASWDLKGNKRPSLVGGGGNGVSVPVVPVLANPVMLKTRRRRRGFMGGGGWENAL
jgi:hypothetical protein